MSRKQMWSIIVVLLMTNVATLVWMNFSDRGMKTDKGTIQDMQAAVAKVGDKSITYASWLSALDHQHGEEVLEQLINQEVVFQLAEEQDMQIEEKLIERELSLMETMTGVMDDDQLQAMRDHWRKQVRYNYLLEALMTQDVGIPEEEMKEYYNQYKQQYEFQKTYQLSHIVVSSSEEAEKVVQELDDGAAFDALAREYSADEETKQKGGYLGYFSEDSSFLSDSYYDVASELEEGEYSKPFPSEQDYILLYVHRTLPAISFTYDELKAAVERQVALQHVGGSFSPKDLWEEIGVDSYYDD
ncbi:peptidyl-prolyl cis-trans isomerase [Pontibacillus litoralis]|uniref:peptidylprolyl isomerase n=1 Tax=Pontibacillus litoralis JSM 072002 TaxID=1385512 RepID=A0A0A5G0F3_9BACI|nr:peptidyl-prolyl cis-trans isomerase [Pontibacillus litoralis]KGX85499.1 protein secretion protein [Pontibacillus litoralis JSM 072002]